MGPSHPGRGWPEVGQVASSGFCSFPHSPDSRLRAATLQALEAAGRKSLSGSTPSHVWSPRPQATTHSYQSFSLTQSVCTWPVSCSGSPHARARPKLEKQVALGPFYPHQDIFKGLQTQPPDLQRPAECPLAPKGHHLDRQWGLPPPQAHCLVLTGAVAHSQHTGGFLSQQKRQSQDSTLPGPWPGMRLRPSPLWALGGGSVGDLCGQSRVPGWTAQPHRSVAHTHLRSR